MYLTDDGGFMRKAKWIVPVLALVLVACSGMQALKDSNPITNWNSLTPQEKSIAMAQQFFTFNASYSTLIKKQNPSKEEISLMQTEYKILGALQTSILAYNDAFASNDPMAMANAEVAFLNAVNNWLSAQLIR